LRGFFQWVDSVLPTIIGAEWAPGVGVLVILIIAYFAGLTAKNYFGKKLIDTGNKIIARIPVLNKVYLAIQQIVDAISGSNKRMFERAVLVEFPKEDSYCIAFVTCDSNAEFNAILEKTLVAVFVPTTPNPTSGFLLYVPSDKVIDLNIPAEIAIKLVMSGGILSADQASRGAIPKSLNDWKGLFNKKKAAAFDPRD
jgi:uncharacterized membrane protein